MSQSLAAGSTLPARYQHPETESHNTAINISPENQNNISAERLTEAVQAAFTPPPLVSFVGALCVNMANLLDSPEPDNRQVCHIPVDAQCWLTVSIETGQRALNDGPELPYDSGLNIWEPIQVRGDTEAEWVQVEVIIDAPSLDVFNTRGRFQCLTTDGSVAYISGFRAGRTGHYDLRIVLLSGGRVVQAIPLELDAIDTEAESP